MAVNIPDIGIPDARAVEVPPPHLRGEEAVNRILQAQAPEGAAPETELSPDPPAEMPESPEQTYARKVKVGDGLELSVGELKEAYKSKSDLESVEKKLTQERADWQADQLRHQRELEEILGSIDPTHVRPELLQARARQFEDYKSRERESLLRKLPEWSNAKTETADKAEILEAVKVYGFTQADLDHAYDHRLLRMVRDFAKLQAKVKAAEVKPTPKVAVEPRKASTPTEAQQFGRLKAAVTKREISSVAAVERLLKGH